MKTNNATPTCATLEDIIRSACDQVRKLMAEDGDPSMRRACAALKEEARDIVLHAVEFSPLYITGECRRKSARRAAWELAARAASSLAPRLDLRKTSLTTKTDTNMILIALICVICWLGPALRDGSNIK